MKADDLRTLDADELGSRLKGARRELYELRFKLAVGQLDDHRQVRKVRKDIARILTVVHARRLGEEVLEIVPEPDEPVAVAAAEPVAGDAGEATNEETPEDVETPAEPEPSAEAEPPAAEPRKTRRSARAGEKGND